MTQTKQVRRNEAESIVEDCIQHEMVGDCLVCEIVDIREKEKEDEINKIVVEVDVPYGKRTWEYEKPYDWDGFFSRLVESHGYGRGNFHEMIGEKVLVRPKSNGKNWVMKTETPHEARSSEGTSLIFRASTGTAMTSLVSLLAILLALVNYSPLVVVATGMICTVATMISFADLEN